MPAQVEPTGLQPARVEPSSIGTAMLTEGAPWRPFDDHGDLLGAAPAARTAAAIVDACNETVTRHLRAVCLWPEETRGVSWSTGDYSFYILSFANANGAEVFVQFWSEPGGKILFEVSSGEWTPPADRFLTDQQREGLRDHGFEIGASRNFTKTVGAAEPPQVVALAREALAVLCRILGYDGTVPLTFRLHLGSRTHVRRVFTHLSPDTLGQLLCEWGFPAPMRAAGEEPVLRCWIDGQPFRIALSGHEGNPPGEYGMINLHAWFDPQGASALELANAVNEHFALMQAYATQEGKLVAEAQILLSGGIAEDNLRSRFRIWQTIIREISQRTRPA
jgi:hypothetical protein